MKQPFVLLLMAAAIVIMLCASDSSTARHNAEPHMRTHHRTAEESALDPLFADMAEAQEALRVLVQTHPRREIRRDLNTLIETHVVTLNFQDSMTEHFGNFASTMILATEDGELLTLAVSPTLLLDERESRELQQLVIYHEYIHIRQVLDGDVPAWTFVPRGAEDIDEEYLRYFIAAEVAAYEAECLFADEIRSEETLQLCVIRNQQGMQAMREAFALTLVTQDGWSGISDLVLRVARDP